jgi:hypothetical protein
VVALVTATIALYELYMAEQQDLILTDPVATARYRAEDVQNALERYDARKKDYVIGEPVLAPTEEVTPEEEALNVAAPAELRVE